MASQQFYSRVPAKISMFNRTDSFDTFACSAELGRDFIEKDLAPLCENRLSAAEAATLRTQNIGNGYYQFTTKDGRLVQSCITYIPVDYTGERSSYLVHNLVYAADEADEVLAQADYDTLNDDMFVKDIAPFDITNPAAKPNRDYDTLDFAPRAFEGTQWILHTFDLMTVKRFIYAMLSAACGRLKAVYFSLPDDDPSAMALRFVNAMLQIMPYHLRGELSFATRINDLVRLPNIKLKALTHDVSKVAFAKGAYFDFVTKTVTGINDADITANGQAVEFFYSLLSNDALRREFLAATHRAVTKVPALGALNLKALSDLVFLFRTGSGMFDEAAILPNDDRMTDFFLLYEKARSAMSNEYRINACRSLQRYPANHVAIPKAVFAKLGKIYPTEIEGTKHVIMSVVLDLIHTDVMRDKLFGFIRANYKGEDAETKCRINDDLARVFYGGFLQQQILEFFDATFDTEPPQTRDFVVGKILLSIRTKAVQQQILDFLDAHYHKLSKDSKNLVYDVFVENLPDGDDLAVQLADWIDSHIGAEKQDTQQRVAKEMCNLLESEQRHKQHPMLEALPRMKGFAYNIMVGVILGAWSGRKIFGEWAEIICREPMPARTELVLGMWQNFAFIDKALGAKLLNALAEGNAKHPTRGDVYALLQQEADFAAAMAATGNAAAAAFAEGYLDAVISPAIGNSALEIFRHPEREGGAEMLVAYVDAHPNADGERMRPVRDYLALKEGILGGDAVQAVLHLEVLPRDKALRVAIAAYLDKEVASAHTVAVSHSFVQAVLNYLRTGELALLGVYEERQRPFDVPSEGDAPAKARNAKKKEEQEKAERRQAALAEVLAVGNVILHNANTEALRHATTAEGAEVREVLAAFVGAQDKQGVAQAEAVIGALKPRNSEFAQYCTQLLGDVKPKKKGLFGKK